MEQMGAQQRQDSAK